MGLHSKFLRLPEIINANQVIGKATVSCNGITTENTTEVFGGLGDMQCAIYSCRTSPNEAGIDFNRYFNVSERINHY